MNIKTTSISAAVRRAYCSAGASRKRSLQAGLIVAALSMSSASQALDFGPDGMFSLTGFAQLTVGQHENRCVECQWVASTEGKDKIWADPLLPGQSYKTVSTVNYQIQPYLGVKYDLGRGYKVSALVSQRWRDGIVDNAHVTDDRLGSRVDVPGFWYEKNIALSHEDYGSLRIGHMTTRSWSVADYPYGTNLGLAENWGSSGAGYGMLTKAVRYTSRVLDVAEGDLVLEATYDRGNTEFKIHKPRFVELYGQFHRGGLVMDAMFQNSHNGGPGAWGHNPFMGLTPFPQDDANPNLKDASQGIAMLMARYQVDSQLELSGGLRRNWWSGASAVQNPTTLYWNNMFNVDWNATLNGVQNPGYPASSYDVLLGARYRVGKWVPSVGLVHLGTARTDNPSDRGQGNSALFSVLGLQYDLGNGLKYDIQAGQVRYARLGLSPMSMPGNASFSDVDSRITQRGNWLILGMVYGF
ncbi:MAG: hypothetical protein WCH35_17155 [Comamonadaceae bacterium]